MTVKAASCFRKATVALIALASCAFWVCAGREVQQVDARAFSALRWRLIGPFRAGRVTAVAGIPGDTATYYMGTPGGGVWKSTDAGRMWKPIFDQEHVASIGALVLAPSDPTTLFVGTGEQTAGTGVYKSTDSGATWTNIGLRETHFIQAILVDPRDSNVLIVGVTGDPTPSTNRGVYKTTDGGKTWKKTLFRDDMDGVMDLCADPDDPRTLYATLMRRPLGPTAPTTGAYSGIFKSLDEGSTWQALDMRGSPADNRGRIGIAVAPGKQGRVVYAIMSQGFFRSEDAGATWRKSTTDPRVLGNTYFSRIFVDPNNADIVYVAQTSLYRSTDGGHTFEAFRGAPGGDDYHVLWIDPHNSRRMFLGVDQGAIISVDGGRSWSSWFNQPTGQFYHVSTDNAFPYRVYGTQQDSGTAGVLSRSPYGEITEQDWFPVGGFENGFIAADPTDSNIVYSQGWYGSVVRFEKATREVATVFVHGDEYHTAAAAPLVFSPHDAHALYFGTQYLLLSTDNGETWNKASPDLTVEPSGVRPHAAKQAEEPGNGPGNVRAITALSFSILNEGEIWAGTSNRLVQYTRDGGKTWQAAGPGDIPEHAQIASIEAGHHGAGTVYVVAGSARRPVPAYVARTHDYGKTWQKIVSGLPPEETVRVVREDPVRKGLLYAGTLTGVYVSFDDGENWQSLQLNLPTATITDLAVHEDDLVASTFGRALWILDDLTPLREMTPQITSESAHFFRPQTAIRVRWDNWPDTPLPPETPAGQNPPNGAILNYYLKAAPAGEITLTVYDEHEAVVRRFSSEAPTEHFLPPNVPEYWFAPPARLTKAEGVNRFVWDLRYAPPQTLPYGYFGERQEYTEYTLPDDAIVGETPRRQPEGPLAVPGNYTLELSVDGQTFRQPLTLKLDPRLRASAADLQDQLALDQRIIHGMNVTYKVFNDLASVQASGNATDSSTPSTKKIDDIQNGTRTQPGLGPINRDLTRIFYDVNSADVRPTASAIATVNESCKALDTRLAELRDLQNREARLKSIAVPQAGCGH